MRISIATALLLGIAMSDAQPIYAAGPTSTIVLSAPPPANAIALVFYEGGAATGWIQITDPKTTTFTVESGGKQCTSPDHSFNSLAGRTVQAAWLDPFGRISAKSSITVARAR